MSGEQCDWYNQIGIRCGQPYGHSQSHGNGLLTTPRDNWHQNVAMVGSEVVATMDTQGNIKRFQEHPTVWNGQSKVPRCIWQGAHGRCIYESLPRHINHEEDTGHAE